MKIQSAAGIMAISLMGCAYNGYEVVNNNPENPPIKERHYNFKTGDLLAQKTLTYDDNRNLTHEVYTGVTSPNADYDITYEYDAQNRLTKSKAKYWSWGANSPLWVVEYTYKNGLKESEYAHNDNQLEGTKLNYFYKDNRIDSIVYYNYSTVTKETHFIISYRYEYDDQGHLIQKNTPRFPGVKTDYVYTSNLLSSTCDYSEVYGQIRQTCRYNEYNSAGQVVRVTESSENQLPPTVNQLQEELFYKDNLLDEKRLYQYYLDGLTPSVLIIQVKYDYKQP